MNATANIQVQLHNQSCTTFVPPLRSFPADNSNHRAAEPLYQNSRVAVCSSGSSDDTDSIRKPPPPPRHVEKERRKGREPEPAAPGRAESPYETGYTTGDTANDLDGDHADHLCRSVLKPPGKDCLFLQRRLQREKQKT